jgi:uncharacterized protein YjiK
MEADVQSSSHRAGLCLLATGPILLLSLAIGCRTGVERRDPWPLTWDVGRSEVIHWRADEPSFNQGFALEASGLATSRRVLYLTSEKYGRLILVDPVDGGRAVVVRLEVPPHSELEGVALTDGGLLLCDEAHATVYEVPFVEDATLATEPSSVVIAARALPLEGVEIRGGKIGFEGIEVDPVKQTVYLLLERSGSDEIGCVSRIWTLQRSKNGLVSETEPIEVALEDCAWRLTGLAWWHGRMLALKTQFPGERYEVVEVDLDDGRTTVLLDLTTTLRALEREGWSNNVEGIAVTDDGTLWLVADNAVTGVIDELVPPSASHKTLLLRIPVAEGFGAGESSDSGRFGRAPTQPPSQRSDVQSDWQ